MIHWLVQSATEEPSIARGIAPAGLLSEAETAQLATYSVEKRRRDWLVGRWTAKELIRAVAQTEYGLLLDPAWIAVLNDDDGAPFARLTESGLRARMGTDGQGRIPWSLSISHSHGVAFCAVSAFGTAQTGLPITEDQADDDVIDDDVIDDDITGNGANLTREETDHAIGADLEFIERRDHAFVQDFFTPAEMALVDGTGAGERERVVTAVWSAKEAVLKALRTGLRLDTRQVECLIRPPLPVTDQWMSFPITVRSPKYQGAVWTGWWQRAAAYPDFVMTLVEKNKIDD